MLRSGSDKCRELAAVDRVLIHLPVVEFDGFDDLLGTEELTERFPEPAIRAEVGILPYPFPDAVLAWRQSVSARYASDGLWDGEALVVPAERVEDRPARIALASQQLGGERAPAGYTPPELHGAESSRAPAATNKLRTAAIGTAVRNLLISFRFVRGRVHRCQ